MSSDEYKYPHSVQSLSVLSPSAPAAAASPLPTSNPPPATSEPLTEIERKLLEGRIIAALKTIYDPEIPVNIHDLGLIYEVLVRADRSVKVVMTLTAPACPVAGSMPGEVQKKVAGVTGVTDAEVQLVWEPAWDRSRMSEEAQLSLGFL